MKKLASLLTLALALFGAAAQAQVAPPPYQFNVGVVPVVQNAAYAAGQSLGGLQTVAIASFPNVTGMLYQFGVESVGGATAAVVIYVWDTLPAATTCTDKTNFVASRADNAHLILGKPLTVTPAVVASAQDTHTYASAVNLVSSFANGSGNGNLYLCVLANGAVTPATTTDLRFQLQGIKDRP